MANLNNLNMQYVGVNVDGNEEIEGGAILECSQTWTTAQLKQWLSGYDFDMIESVKNWLEDDAQIAEGCYLKVWTD